jgi:hypothetical protein
MLHLLQTAVTPRLSLADCLPKWPEIALALSEPPRKREPQATRLGLSTPILS